MVVLVGSLPAAADTTAQSLPFGQDWTNTGLITVDDNWSGVPGVIGYRGDDLTTATGTDPQTIVADGSSTPIDVNANQTNPNTFATGGVAEFHLANPVVALNGSGTADAPQIVLSLDTTGKTGITVSYNLRDIDGSTDNAVQPIAVQFRVGSSGSFTNLAAGYVADATTGPSLATQVTPVNVTLSASANNQPLVQIRVITTNAAGNDEWVGVDDIVVTGGAVPPPDTAPFVAATSPPNGASEVPKNANVDITFSEPVSVASATFSISCTTSGAHTFALSGGASIYTLNPNTDFANGETCTVTVDDVGVSDSDSIDPPDNMASDYTFSFTTQGLSLRIHDIQGAQHRSPFEGALVSQVPGVVTARSSIGFWFQDPEADADPKTSEGLFVFTGSSPTVTLGQAVRVNGRVTEFRPGGLTSANLTTTEIAVPTVIPAGPGPTIPTTVVGLGGRTPPTAVIENDSSGDVETSNTFDPQEDGIDFYETLEGMLVRINDAVATGPRNSFGEISVLGDFGANASVRTTRGGIVVRRIGDYTYQQGDFNPERMILDDVIRPTPVVHVRDGFTTPVDAIVDYGFGNVKLLVVNDLVRVAGGLQREFARTAKKHELVVATYNVENLDPTDAPSGRFQAAAEQIVERMKSPDLINVEEIQDNDGAVSAAPTDASVTWRLLIEAIQAAGGPLYDYRQIDPLSNTDGGEPNGNIRVGFLFRTDRGLRFVDRPGGTAVTPNDVVDTRRGAQLLYSPGRIDPNNPAFASSRKPLAGEFVYEGRKLFVIGNHFNSKGGDDPLFGRFQPPNRRSEVQRHQQAAIVNAFVDRILAADRDARVIVLGDLNDFQFSQTMDILKGDVLVNLYDTLPLPERYSYVFDGNSQALDHILVSLSVRRVELYDVVHMNSEFADQLSDHDPPLAYLRLTAARDGDHDDDD